jgi:hypothetical protein
VPHQDVLVDRDLGRPGAEDRPLSGCGQSGAAAALVFHGCGGATDYTMFRYLLASTLMGKGYFSFNSDGDLNSVAWYDEYDVKLGAPLQGSVAAFYPGGVCRRDFENGIELVNPRGNGRQTAILGGTVHKTAGEQDPTINNGQAVSSVTLNAADGFVLTR